jgi:hypothetical protein
MEKSMSSFNALLLTPADVNYLTSKLVFQQLSQNPETLVATNDDVTIDSEAKVLLNGSGMAQLKGFVTIDSNPSAAMELCELPPPITPASEGIFPVAVKRGDAYVANGIQITKGGGSPVASVTVNTPGSYSVVPTVSTIGPGVGATFAAHMRTLTVTNVAAGSGYAPTNTITLTGGTFSQAIVLTVATTKLVSIAINAAGSGYAVNDTITLAGGAGATPAVLTVTTVSTGAITGVSITNAGSFTTNSATFTQASTSGSGTGATFNTALFGVNTQTVTNVGNYTVIPSNPVSQGSTSGSGTGYTCNVVWQVLSVAVTAGGEGYTSSSHVIFSSGAATASLVLGAVERSKVILLNAPNANDEVYLDSALFLTQEYN